MKNMTRATRVLALVLLTAAAVPGFAQGGAFTYNGQLTFRGALANGNYDLEFSIYDAEAGGTLVKGPLPANNQPAVNGALSVRLDFGANVFTGPPRWLQIAVRPVGGGALTPLTPRQEVTSSPYAIRAQTAGSVANGTIAASQLNTAGAAPGAGQFLSYNGANLFWSDPAVAAGGVWSLLNNNASYSAGNVGVGAIATGTSKLQITGADALTMTGAGPYLTWHDTTTGKSAAISSALGTLYYRVPDAAGKTVTAGYVDSNGSVVRGRLSLEGAGPFITWNDSASGRSATISSAGGTLYYRVPNAAGTVLTAGYVDSNGLVVNGRIATTGAIYVTGNASVATLTIRGGADLAEPFELSKKEIPKGSVVVIDSENEGKLKLSEQSYDQRVAGVVSGANGVNPGISLRQEGVLEGGQNVALSGRVYVLADAGTGPIKPGDLLTTSDTPGHAMKVADQSKAQGAILGKAMSGLKEGRRLVLVLVTLQ